MNLCADTNVLLRAVIPIEDDSVDAIQSRTARALLREAASIAVPLPALCEFAWVLRSVYRFERSEIARAIRALLDAPNVRCDRRAALAGLQVLDANGDFADGLIAELGFDAGADTFVSFDRRAVRLLSQLGRPAQVPR